MSVHRVAFHPGAAGSSLAQRLKREVEGDVLFDRASRGRYSTDASIYQVEPIGVVVPRTEAAAVRAMEIALEAGVPILPRGAGSSQCGQTVGAALVIDHSKHLNEVVELDPARATVTVQPGMVLDRLNALLRPHGLWFPVDVSTSAQATIGGMAGNNSCGSRSIRYGNMVHNVAAIDARLADGTEFRFGPSDEVAAGPVGYRALAAKLHAIVHREADEIAAKWPQVLRRVQGYNIDMLRSHLPHNLAHLLVGSEGTLAYSQRLTLKLAPIPRHKTLGVCHFPTFYRAMESAQHIVKLDPDAVELVDRTMIDLARANRAFEPIVRRFVQGEPAAILLVEFAGDEATAQVAKLKRLVELMGDLGLPGSVVEIADARLQKDVWEVRKAGLNIMMSMKGDGKPVSFIEDCAVPLEHLAEYTDRLTKVFEKHGTKGTWYAHASVGTLHVRPILDMRTDGARKMRAIAEEACAMVREFKGAYSGEHGDGLVRSEWIEPIVGARLTRALGEIKALFDPKGLMNPGKIVRPSKMDDRTLFRFKPGYAAAKLDTALDWSEWSVPGAQSQGFAAAVEMCNNNGHCRKFDAGTMCPSFRATGDEQHLTRGRANTLRLAISGQLGPDALSSDALYETLSLCVSCKGCKRECPTGVDMAKMKIEFLHHYHGRRGWSMKDRAVAFLPRYAPLASRAAGLLNLRDRIPLVASLTEKLAGLSARRRLPVWRSRPFLRSAAGRYQVRAPEDCDLVLLVDTFNNYFEPENAHAALRVLEAAGSRVHVARAAADRRPLCCGRTFLAAGMVNEARVEAQRTSEALAAYVARGIPIVGLEPSCLFGLRDEFLSMLPGEASGALAMNAFVFEEFLAREADAGRLALKLKPLAEKKALLHGHCHQKAFGAMGAVERALALVPGLAVETIESSCCGMAGAFGYEAKHYDVSMRMAEASLLPKVRAADAGTLVVADGTSCRHQIRDGAGREAMHVARVLEMALT
ncbi:MAG TPA: FAD-linked oxidase C-terminal domain-containing protein [Burkholderiales bacterium]|nr:FAD-linked oxidase C-terminal domain-containing protein [Burkholderiales bacterium]